MRHSGRFKVHIKKYTKEDITGGTLISENVTEEWTAAGGIGKGSQQNFVTNFVTMQNKVIISRNSVLHAMAYFVLRNGTKRNDMTQNSTSLWNNRTMLRVHRWGYLKKAGLVVHGGGGGGVMEDVFDWERNFRLQQNGISLG